MSKQDVIDYVMNTPYNTNEAVLRTLLDGLNSSDDNQENNYQENYIVPPQLMVLEENESLIVDDVDVSTLEDNELAIIKIYTTNEDIIINLTNYDAEEKVFYFGTEKTTDIMSYDSIDECWIVNMPNTVESFAIAITKILTDDVKQFYSNTDESDDPSPQPGVDQ